MQQHLDKFREHQYAYWIFIIFLAISIFLFLKYDTGTFVYPVIALALIAVVFYRLTIILNNKEIVAYFGFGMFKRKMSVSEMDFSSIQKDKRKVVDRYWHKIYNTWVAL